MRKHRDNKLITTDKRRNQLAYHTTKRFSENLLAIEMHRDIKLVTTDRRRNRSVSEPNYHASKHFSENLMEIEMKKTEVKMNKPVYLGMSILYISKTLMYEFWYDYIKPKYQERAKLCYMDTDSFVIHIETEYFYEDIAGDVEKWFDTSNYEENDKRPLPIGKNKKIIVFFKDELGGKIMNKFAGLRAKSWANLLNDNTENKKAKRTKRCIIKRRLKFENYIDCLFNDKFILLSQQRFKSDCHDVCTEEVNKAALTSNDDERLQTIDKFATYPHKTNAFKVCESDMLNWMMLVKKKKAKTKKCVIIRRRMFENYIGCLFRDKIILQS